MKTLLRLSAAVIAASGLGGSDAGAAEERLDSAPPGSFSIVVIPDTQKYRGRGTKMDPKSTDAVSNATLESHCRWIAANLETQRIVFVTHVGDIVDRNVPEQWEVARRCMGFLDGRVPYGIAPGNHDMRADGDATLFVREFGRSRFAGRAWYGGVCDEAPGGQGQRGGASSFQLFSAGGCDFVILHLECNAPDGLLAWADGVLRAHAARLAIVTTHMDLGPIQKPKDEDDFFDGPKGRMAWKKVHGARGNTPQQVWDKCLRKQENLLLILSGDQSRTQAMRLVSKGDEGRLVHAVLSDYNRDAGDWLRVLRFFPERRRIDVFTVNSGDGSLCAGTELVPDSGQHCFSLECRLSGERGGAGGSAKSSGGRAPGPAAGLWQVAAGF